jgi:DNA-binding CsgD family transcriptional regulator
VFAPGGPRAGVLAEDDAFRVVHAARMNGAATIDVFRMDQDLVTQLIQEKLRRLGARAQLSPRERLVLHLSCEGKGIKEIAQAAAISQRTARFHVTNLLRKLGTGSRQEVLPLLLRPLPSPRARVARRRRP